MTKCRATCLHRALVQEYRAYRAADEARVERESYGYATETREHVRPAVTFKRWLQDRRGYQESAA